MDARREEILSHLMLLDSRACVRLRPSFPIGRGDRWYADFGKVVIASLSGRGFVCHLANGATPEEALDTAWDEVLRVSRDPALFLMIYACAPDVPIPGPDPQVWVRWDETKATWVDVAPDAPALAIRDIPPDRIRPYAEHRWRSDLH